MLRFNFFKAFKYKFVSLDQIIWIREPNQWAPRGDWRRRAMKEKSRNRRDPVLSDRESETFIVAKKDLTNLSH
jgi:hypothetical protein